MVAPAGAGAPISAWIHRESPVAKRSAILTAMEKLLLVGFGGFIGAIARYKLSELAMSFWDDWRFPLGTFSVNVVGCLIAGVLVGFAMRYGDYSLETRLFLFTGLLGGFTTFSAFGVEIVYMLRQGMFSYALTYVIVSVVCSTAALGFGIALSLRRGGL